MSAPLLSELREPPVVGRFYMVPTVRYRMRGATQDWPVIGPRHDDANDLNFPHLHYHFDLRFMSAAMVDLIEGPFRDIETAVSGVVLVEPVNIENDLRLQQLYGRLPAKPTLRRRKCRRATYAFSEHVRDRLIERNGSDRIAERYGAPAAATRRNDSRLLCPHRKVDLSSFPPDSDGIVTCPLHGLRVRCSPASLPSTTGE